MEKYRFSLSINDAQPIEVHPNYSGDLAYEKSMANGEQFLRTKLKGSLIFVATEYDLITASPFDSTFVVEIEVKASGGVWVPFLTGSFVKTDGKYDADARTLTVSLTERDQYNGVMRGISKKFDIVQLTPNTTACKITKRGMFQVYLPNDEVIGGFLGNVYFETSVTEPTGDHEKLRDVYKFGLNAVFGDIEIKGSNTAVNARYTGKLSKVAGVSPDEYKGNMYPEVSNGYYIQFEIQPNIASRYTFFIKRVSDNAIIASKDLFDQRTHFIAQMSGGEIAEVWSFRPYTRMLTDLEVVSGNNTFLLAEDDIVENNRNYRRVYAINTDNLTIISRAFSTTPTKWGRVGNTQYFFEKPYILGSPTILPVSRSQWMSYVDQFTSRVASVWVISDILLQTLSEQFDKQYTLRDAYTLADVIKTLLNQIDTNVQHEATSEYSQFLYGGGGIGNGITLLLAPKSNVLEGEYDRPATRAEVTLRDLLNVLRDIYKCYWYIEGGKFKIEQVQFFVNGGSYGSTPLIGADLSDLNVVGGNDKRWSDRTSKFEYDKLNIPEQITFQWADKSSEGFTAIPMQIESKNREEGKIDSITTTVSADVDLMLLQPSDFSPDGLALLGAQQFEGLYELPIDTVSISDSYLGSGQQYVMQNAYLSPLYFQPAYWRYEMPASMIKINGSPITPLSVQRNKIQTVEFPSNFGFDTQKTVKTPIGVGRIEEFSLNLQDGMAEVKLRHETE